MCVLNSGGEVKSMRYKQGVDNLSPGSVDFFWGGENRSNLVIFGRVSTGPLKCKGLD